MSSARVSRIASQDLKDLPERRRTTPLGSSAARPSYLKTGSPVLDSSHADRSKAFDLDVYWKEFQQVRESATQTEADEPEEQLIPTPVESDCGEEKQWLIQAGLEDVAEQLQENKIVDIDNVKQETSKLNFTNLQTAAVVRRVTRANTAIRRWKSKTYGLEKDVTSANSHEIASPKGSSTDLYSPTCGADLPVGCELVLTPSSESVHEDDGDFLIYGNETDTARDFVTLRQDSTGLSSIDDFSEEDCVNLRRIALVELTTVLDKYNIPMRPFRYRKVKKAPSHGEHAILGVPLTTLMERDRAVDPTVTIPIFATQIIEFLEQSGLHKEGIFRVPGNSAKLKRLREEMESSPISSFSWEGRSVNDAATTLKQFLRELPVPLLTFDYLHLFASAESLTTRKLQLKVVNLLLILLPDVHRELLKRLLVLFNNVIDLEEKNKMGVNNVAMIVAPNLFCKLEQATGNAEAEVKFAAGSSHTVRFFITFSPLLFCVPGTVVKQLRFLNEVEARKVGKKAKSAKELQKLLKMDLKRERSTTTPQTIDLKFDGIDGPSNESADRCVIKVLSPDFPKISMAMEISEGMTSAGVLEQFIKRQAAFASSENDDVLDDSQPMAEKGMLSVSRSHSPRASFCSTQSDPRQYRPRTNSVSVADSLSLLFFNGDTEVDLFEVGGNVCARRLRVDCEIMAVRRVNPAAQWVIRKRHGTTP